MTLVELVREYQEASKTQDDARFSAACVALLDYQLPASETPAPDYVPPSTSNTVHSGDGSVRDHTAWIAMCERRKAETPAPDAMPEVRVGDVVTIEATDVTVVSDMHRDWVYADPQDRKSITRVKRNGVVIWRRQEAQP